MHMEKLFHYAWKHKMFPQEGLKTTAGLAVEVLDVGLHNHDAGPDFFNAKIKIDGQLWVGNVELHIKSSNWRQHHHELDAAYNNVILHVVCEADCEVWTKAGEQLPQLEIPLPERLRENYEQLLMEDKFPRCFRLIPTLSHLMIHSWLNHLSCERLERKTSDIKARLERNNGSWEDAFFQTLARNFGYNINSEAMEIWARSFPLQSLAHHRDNPFQLQAIFLGQAGLIKDDELELQNEYSFLAHKFGFEPIDKNIWRYLRLRPQNFPRPRILQLAQLYYDRAISFSQLIECDTAKDVYKLLKAIPKSSLDGVIINTVVPILFAYGRFIGDESMTMRALDMLDQLKAEDNKIVRLWRECSLEVTNASDSQALIQLKNEYCDTKDCLRCRIGHNYLKVY